MRLILMGCHDHKNIVTQNCTHEKIQNDKFPILQHISIHRYAPFCYQMSIKGCKLRKVQEFTYGPGANCFNRTDGLEHPSYMIVSYKEPVYLNHSTKMYAKAVPGQVQTHLEKYHMKEVLATVFDFNSTNIGYNYDCQQHQKSLILTRSASYTN